MTLMPALIAVLGMHRSGTSSVAGTLQHHGIELGPVSEANRFNPRGNRELRKLNRLHDRILERSGGSWWRPPEEVLVEPGDRLDRDDILAAIPGSRIGVKDPRMLLLLDFWRELEPLWIGVIRNPVAVRRSLERRAQERGKPRLEADRWEGLWRHYNWLLLEELDRSPFPVIDFDRTEEIDAQVRAALDFYGIESRGESAFFDPELVREASADAWRSRVLSPESLELWDRLAALTMARA
jgi:hypothetical protein